jgi:hypothetical protein
MDKFLYLFGTVIIPIQQYQSKKMKLFSGQENVVSANAIVESG